MQYPAKPGLPLDNAHIEDEASRCSLIAMDYCISMPGLIFVMIWIGHLIILLKKLKK